MDIKKITEKGIKYVSDGNYRFIINANKGKYDSMPDEEYLTKKFRATLKENLNLDNPVTFNEKLQWMKLYDRNPLYTVLVDKFAVRKYVAEKIGEEYLIPLLGEWDSADDIDFDSLPEKFVLKCNHNSGLGMCICKDKKALDIEKTRKNLNSGLEQDYYLQGREWPYKDVKRKIVCEQYMEDVKTKELRDYKFFVFGGQVKMMFIASDRQKDGDETKFDYFDENFNHLDFTTTHPNADVLPEKPENFDKMKELAVLLADNLPQVRVDFYEANGRIYFGELTFFHWSGFADFQPREWDKKIGEWLKLPNKKIR